MGLESLEMEVVELRLWLMTKVEEGYVAWVEKRKKLGVGGRYLYGFLAKGLILGGRRQAQ
jgi:hypothetical protein